MFYMGIIRHSTSYNTLQLQMLLVSVPQVLMLQLQYQGKVQGLNWNKVPFTATYSVVSHSYQNSKAAEEDGFLG